MRSRLPCFTAACSGSTFDVATPSRSNVAVKRRAKGRAPRTALNVHQARSRRVRSNGWSAVYLATVFGHVVALR
jgi:hypothetical protein